MKGGVYYYSPTTGGFYNTEVNTNIPVDAISISRKEYTELLDKQSDGHIIEFTENGVFTIVPDKDLTFSERSWRDFELTRSDVELYKVQDSDPNAIGTVSDWRNYRKALRAWPEHEHFPDKAYRPIPPEK
jgi:hypothetical protein